MGSSTAALAVSTSHTTWPSVTVSPALTYHLRISASGRPSPASGILNPRTDASVIVVPTLSSVRQGTVDGVEYPVQARQVLLLQAGRRVGGVIATDPEHRGLQVIEAALGDPGRDLRARTEEHRGLVELDQAPGLLHRGLDRVADPGRDRAQIQELQRLALLGARVGDLLAELHHRAVRDEGQVGALTDHLGLVQGAGDRLGVDLALVPVPALGLEEDHRVVALD